MALFCCQDLCIYRTLLAAQKRIRTARRISPLPIIVYSLYLPLPTYLPSPSDGEHTSTCARRGRKKHNRPGDMQKYQLKERENIGVVRHHIRPLNPETIHPLLQRNVLADRAVGSMYFNAFPSFPEKGYGYLDCVRDVADGIKKKLNEGFFRRVKVICTHRCI